MATEFISSSCQVTQGTVICAKCRHPNPDGVERCACCQKHLFIFCHECGLRNPRSNGRCDQCQSPLHHCYASPPPSHKLYWPYCWRYDPTRSWIIPVQIACLLLASLAVASLSVNPFDYFNGLERCLFPDLFNEFPTMIPRRYLYPAHAVTLGLFLLPFVLGALVITWLARQSIKPPRSKPF